VVKEGDYFALEYGKYKFARLSKGLCCNLRALVAESQVRIQAFVLNKDWTTAVRSSTLLLVDINIYGSREDAEEVGRTLSKSGTFLQFPRYGLDGVEYYNPHLFRIEGYPEQVPIETVPWPAEGVIEIPDRSVEEETQLNDSLVVDSILDSLSHHVPLREIPVDSRIKSTLLP
jgi:SWI/SNF-related matrix-associated actin-dependent regulator of chromatin subfamily A3